MPASRETAGHRLVRRATGHRVTRTVTRVTVLGFAVASVVGLGVGGFLGGSGPSTVTLTRVDRVLLISVPGLRWQDLDALDTPGLDRWLLAGALLSVRAIGSQTSLLEGYLTMNAGNRLSIEDVGTDRDPVPELTGDGSACLPELVAQARTEADADLNGSMPGSLGSALTTGGLRSAVYGAPGAIAALMDEQGCVDQFSAVMAPGPLELSADVTLVEFRGLEDTEVAAQRTAVITEIDAAVKSFDLDAQSPGVRSLGADGGAARTTAVIVVAPSAVAAGAEVTVLGYGVAGGAGDEIVGGSLFSATTRRGGYVALTDIAPTIVQLLEAGDIPEAMSGRPMTLDAARRADADAEGLGERIAGFADLADRVDFRDRAVAPVSVAFVVLIVLCGASVLGRRGRTARMLAPILAAYPTVTFLFGLVSYHRLPLAFFVVSTVVVAITLAAVSVSALSRFGPWAATTALSALLWAMMIVDVVAGGSLQINTPLGYTPTIAGRFQGFGNLAFGLVASTAMVTAVIGVLRCGRQRGAVLFAAWVGVVTLIAVAAPAFGSDVGGTLALIPAFGLMLLWLTGRRLSWLSALLAVAMSAVAVGLLAAIDLSRAEESRTHLGRFLDDLLHGRGGLILRRKLRGNVSILTSSFWSLILVGVVAVALMWCWRNRSTVAAAVAGRPAVAAFGIGWTTAAILGFALNDSGLVVPGVMLAGAISWLVCVMIVPMTRAERRALAERALAERAPA